MKSPALIVVTLFFALFAAPIVSESAQAESTQAKSTQAKSTRAAGLPAMTVWKSPSCGCCAGWVTHMRGNGFTVTVKETEDLGVVKKLSAVPDRLQSCHTAKVGGYVIEGHVPAKDVKRLLKTRPSAHGLAVPGMPSGSPGMENGQYDRYDVLLFKRDGGTTVFGSYP